MNRTPFLEPVADAMLPLALRIVSAVRNDDPAELLDVTATAKTIGGPGWATALVMVLAALVPDDRPVSELTGWLDPMLDDRVA